MNFIDLFAGAGGLSEGFIRQGFNPIAHVEMDKNACQTLLTRSAYHFLKENNNLDKYYSYLKTELSQDDLWNLLPKSLIQSVINQEISDETLSSIFSQIDSLLDGKKIDLVIGGPPCQAYSLIGRSRSPDRMVGDKRNYLFKYYVEFLKKYKPRMFVFENVRGLISAGSNQYLQEMKTLFNKAGYTVDLKILNSSNYGVLQKRNRVIIIGKYKSPDFKFPEIKSYTNNWNVKEHLFSDLPNLQNGQELHIAQYTKPINEYLKLTGTRNGVDFVTQHITRTHNERDLEIYSIAIQKWINANERLSYADLPERLRTHKNVDIFHDRFKVVDPFGHSHTMVAHISKDGHHYIYPDLKQIRSLSVREAARIQSFPDNYFFEGGRTSAFKQIGNAVPPLFSNAIAKSLKTNYFNV